MKLVKRRLFGRFAAGKTLFFALVALFHVGCDSDGGKTGPLDGGPDQLVVAGDASNQQGDAKNQQSDTISPAPQTAWVKGFGATSFVDKDKQYGESVAVDGAGNIVITGSFVGTVDFGTGPLKGVGRENLFVASYDASGKARWVKRFGSGVGKGVAVDGDGNVVVTGQISGKVDFGTGPLDSTMGRTFLASFDSSGKIRWAKNFGCTGSCTGVSGQGWDVATDGAGNIVITGTFFGSADFGNGSLASAGASDIFLASYDSAGKPRWSKRFGGSSRDFGASVAMDKTGNSVVTGWFLGKADFGTGPVKSAGSDDVFLASYDSSGKARWSKRFGAKGDDRGAAVAIDGAGNVVVTGSFQDSVDFGGEPLFAARERGTSSWRPTTPPARRVGPSASLAGARTATTGGGAWPWTALETSCSPGLSLAGSISAPGK